MWATASPPSPIAERRARNMRNHTATHLMNAALRNILGTHVKQAGSLVAPDHLRFDFSHFAAVDPSELAEIEQQVNEEIRKNLEVSTDIMNIDDALASGALAFFGDKYPEANVRVVTIPDASSPRGFYSKELCGGTHVDRTGAIGVFKIIAEQSTAAGVRRIEAISGDRALAEYQRALATLRDRRRPSERFGRPNYPALERQIDQIRSSGKAARSPKTQGCRLPGAGSARRSPRGEGRARSRRNRSAEFDRETLRQMVDTLRQKLGSGVVVLASAEDGKVALITGSYERPDPQAPRRKNRPGTGQAGGRFRWRQTRFGRGWRKRHIRHRKSPRPRLPPPRPIAIIPIAPEAYAGRSLSAGLPVSSHVLEISSRASPSPSPRARSERLPMARGRITVVILAAGFWFSQPAPSHAQIASYTDENGKVVYVNKDSPKRRRGSTISSPSGPPADGPVAASPGLTSSGASADWKDDRLDRIVREAAERHKVDPALVKAVITTESGWNPQAVSRKGAVGLMQLIPQTAQRFGVNNSFDPAQNVEGGTTYLRSLLDRYNGDLSKSLAAYNAGERAVDLSGGVPDYRETRMYVQKVTNTYFRPGSGRDQRSGARRGNRCGRKRKRVAA